MLTVKDTVLDPISDQSITSLSSSTALTVPEHATMALIQAFTQNVRIRFTGSAPDASTGHIIYSGDIGYWATSKLDKVRLIEVTASASVFVTYFK
jgi:hypothetical protein